MFGHYLSTADRVRVRCCLPLGSGAPFFATVEPETAPLPARTPARRTCEILDLQAERPDGPRAGANEHPADVGPRLGASPHGVSRNRARACFPPLWGAGRHGSRC